MYSWLHKLIFYCCILGGLIVSTLIINISWCWTIVTTSTRCHKQSSTHLKTFMFFFLRLWGREPPEDPAGHWEQYGSNAGPLEDWCHTHRQGGARGPGALQHCKQLFLHRSGESDLRPQSLVMGLVRQATESVVKSINKQRSFCSLLSALEVKDWVSCW